MIKNKEISYFIGGKTDTEPQKDTITIEETIKVMTDNESYAKMFQDYRNGKSLDKGKLPNFTLSGQFTYRNNLSLIKDSYTWLCPIDIDYNDNTNVDMDMIKNIITSEDFVVFCGKSPRGKGLKVIIRLKENSYDIDNHYKIITENIYPKLEKDLGCKFDVAQAKLSQPFFFTYDANAYVNYDATELETDYTLREKLQSTVIVKPTGDKDYLIDNSCNEILQLTADKWSTIGSIGYKLGGWYASGYFTLSDTEIKSRLKEAVDANQNILNKEQKYIQIDLTFQNGVENPLTIKDENVLVDIDNIHNDEFIVKSTQEEQKTTEEVQEERELTRSEQKKFRDTLGKVPVFSVIEYTGEVYDSNKKYKINNYLFYPILKEGQLGMLFGYTGGGKSVVAVEIGNMIAKGSSDWSLFRVDTPPQRVLYIDFELGASSFQARYGDDKFNDNFIIYNVDVNMYNTVIGFNTKQGERIDRAISFIEELAVKYDSKILFIDNLSNIADQVEQAAEADRFISDLYGRMKALELTIMFIGHTPKIPNDVALSLNQLKGSSSLQKSFETVIGFKRSVDKNISYIKQLKSRQQDHILDDESVAKFEFVEDSIKGWYLNFLGTCDEIDLLPQKNSTQKTKYNNELKIKVLHDINVNNIPYDKIFEEYEINNTALYRFRQDLKTNKYNLKNEYNEYCKQQLNVSEKEKQVQELKNKILKGVKFG